MAVKGGDPSFRVEKYLISWVRLLPISVHPRSVQLPG